MFHEIWITAVVAFTRINTNGEFYILHSRIIRFFARTF